MPVAAVWTLATLEANWPSIPWREPVFVRSVTGVRGYACRVCIANTGLRGREIHELPDSPESVLAHIAADHDAQGPL